MKDLQEKRTTDLQWAELLKRTADLKIVRITEKNYRPTDGQNYDEELQTYIFPELRKRTTNLQMGITRKKNYRPTDGQN